ncbi:MAG: hypothetical protein IPJ40_24360 [Saprospirales bacterium]|nr:hypothetical protein [Saprospirales bacterium]
METILEDSRFDLLASVGHGWIQLPSAPEEWLASLNAIPPLNPIQFADIVHNYCHVKGLVGELFHRLKGQVREIFNGSGIDTGQSRIRESLDRGFAELKSLLQEHPNALSEVAQIEINLKIIDEDNIKELPAYRRSGDLVTYSGGGGGGGTCRRKG